MFRRMTLPALCALLLSVPALADAQELAGQWTAEYPRSVRNINGVAEAGELGTAVLTLEAKGDSVFGTWLPQNTPTPAKPRGIRGTFAKGKLMLVSEPTEITIRRNMGGDTDDTPVRVVTYYEAELKDGVLQGTFRGESEDKTIQMPELKWTARRSH